MVQVSQVDLVVVADLKIFSVVPALSRVVHSHWSRSKETLRYDWIRS